jgi:hypothetical protein
MGLRLAVHRRLLRGSQPADPLPPQILCRSRPCHPHLDSQWQCQRHFMSLVGQCTCTRSPRKWVGDASCPLQLPLPEPGDQGGTYPCQPPEFLAGIVSALSCPLCAVHLPVTLPHHCQCQRHLCQSSLRVWVPPIHMCTSSRAHTQACLLHVSYRQPPSLQRLHQWLVQDTR